MNLHVIDLLNESRIAVVHPSTGAFAYVEGHELVSQIRDTMNISEFGICTINSNSFHLFNKIWQQVKQSGSYAETNTQHTKLDTLILKLTNRCNEACMHCYDACGEPEEDATLELLKPVIEDAFSLSGGKLYILFHGGEPFLKFNLLQDLVNYAEKVALKNQKEVDFYVQTNASIFNRRIIDFLSSHNFKIGISLDGPQPVHDKMRIMQDGSGTYRLFEKNYRRHFDYIINNSGILTTVMALNVSILSEVVLHVRDLGFATWECTLFDSSGKGALFPEQSVDPELFYESYCKILDLIESGELDGVAVKPVLTRLDNLLLPNKPNMCLPGNGPCGAGKRLLSVSSNGEIRGCDIIHDRNLSLGNIQTNTIIESTDHKNVIKMQNRLNDGILQCHQCTWLGVCGGTCLARSSLNSVNSVDCALSKKINPELMRRMASSNKLVDWYRRFPVSLRNASAIKKQYQIEVT